MAAYTTIDDPSAYHQVDLYTGNGSADHAQTFDGNSNLLPGLLFMSKRAGGGNYGSFMVTSHPDATVTKCWERGSGQMQATQRIASFNSDGYTPQGTSYYQNENNSTYVTHAFASGGTTASANTDGDIDSSIVVDTTMGLSLVTWTGNDTDAQTIGHGLGARPNAIWVYPIAPGGDGNTQRIWWWEANTDGYAISNGLNDSQNTEENDLNGTVSGDASGEGTTSVFTVSDQNSADINTNNGSGTYLACVWTNIQGFSKHGQYVGNGNANGTFVYCGFRPATVIIRNMDRAAGQNGYDTARAPSNPANESLNWVDHNGAELSDGNTIVDILSNGFKIRTTGVNINASGETIGFSAWAEQPFVTSTGIPATAR